MRQSTDPQRQMHHGNAVIQAPEPEPEPGRGLGLGLAGGR